MNERIQELAQVAERLADDELAHLERVHNRLYSFTEGREIYNQKFAELIVQECVRIIDNKKDQAIDEEWKVDEAMSAASFDIEDHFGIKE
jgi:hypothetical protein